MKIQHFLGVFSVMLISLSSYSQLGVTGPTCVIPDIEYRYIISSSADSAMKICVSGGTIVSGQPNCAKTASASVLKIKWNSNQPSGSINITSSQGNSLLYVGITNALKGGLIGESVVVQKIDNSTIPANLICSSSTGGACNPSFRYQWQQSPDNQDWSDMSGATNRDFSFNMAPQFTTYYRRKTTESSANSIAYSNTALVIVQVKSSNN